MQFVINYNSDEAIMFLLMNKYIYLYELLPLFQKSLNDYQASACFHLFKNVSLLLSI